MSDILSPGITFGDVNCAVYFGEDGQDGGIRETWTEHGLEVEISFIVGWGDRLKFYQALRGAAVWNGTGVVRRLPYHLPDLISDFSPDLEQLTGTAYRWHRYFCVGFGETRPLKAMTDQTANSLTGLPGWPIYAVVIVPTRWAVPTYYVSDAKVDVQAGGDISGRPYTTTTIRVSGDVYSPNTGTYKFALSNEPTNEASVGIIQAKQEFSIVRHYMPVLDVESYNRLIGKVNESPIEFTNTTYEQDSWLYLGYEYESYGDISTGALVYDIKHQIVVKSAIEDAGGEVSSSWNYFLNRGGNWDKLVTTDSESPVYKLADFESVIWPEGY
jgi:hypothetical protein